MKIDITNKSDENMFKIMKIILWITLKDLNLLLNQFYLMFIYFLTIVLAIESTTFDVFIKGV